MTDLEALDVAADLERAGLYPGEIRRELRARGASDEAVEVLAPSWSPCGLHEFDRDPGEACPVCARAHAAIVSELDAEIAVRDSIDVTRAAKWQRRVAKAGGAPPPRPAQGRPLVRARAA